MTRRVDCSETVVPDVVDGPCTFLDLGHQVRVSWDLEDLKRVIVRYEDGWLATVEAPEMSVLLEDQPNGRKYFLLAKTNDGQTSRVECVQVSEIPRLDAQLRPTAEPTCSYNEDIGRATLFNYLGSANLRNEDGWVATLDELGSVFNLDPSDSYEVVVRNPISGLATFSCGDSSFPSFTERVWGGRKASLTPNLNLENDAFKIVEKSPFGYFSLVNKETGAALDLRTGPDWRISGVSPDGKTILAVDTDHSEYDYEIQLSDDLTTLTYFQVGATPGV